MSVGANERQRQPAQTTPAKVNTTFSSSLTTNLSWTCCNVLVDSLRWYTEYLEVKSFQTAKIILKGFLPISFSRHVLWPGNCTPFVLIDFPGLNL